MWTAQDVLADLLNTPEVTRRGGGFMYDPDLARFGNAVSPLVTMPSYGAAQRAMQRPFADRYSSRYDQPDATDWLMMALEQGQTMVGQGAGGGSALWQKIEGVLHEQFGWTPSNMPGSSRWYAPITDGAFFDAVFAFKDAGATCTGDPPKVTCHWLGATFVLVHDVEDGLRVFITDYGPFPRQTGRTATSGLFERIEDKTGLGKTAIAAAVLIACGAGALASRHPKRAVEIGLLGATCLAVTMALTRSSCGC